MKTLLQSLLLSVFAVLLFPLAACALSGEAIEGKVIEEGTDRPVANAIVVARWLGNVPAFAESRNVCVHVDTVTADTEGGYRFSRWSKPSTVGPIVQDLRPVVMAYQPGYQYVRGTKERTIYLQPFAGGREERLKYLQRVEGNVHSCRSPEAGEKSLLPLYRALYEEAKPLARTREEQIIRDGFLSEIEILELGYKEGMRRALERAEKRDRQP